MAKKKTTAKKKTKASNKDKDGLVKPVIEVPECILVDEMIREQKRHWEIADGTKALPNAWYETKRKCLILLKSRKDDGCVDVISHQTGNTITVPPSQIIHFTPSSDPGTPCGTIITGAEDTNNGSMLDKVNVDLYSKYPHIVQGSIYKVQNISGTDGTPAWERKMKGKKINIKGQVRCKITCQEPDCTNERDIKVQDAFQVKKCEECKNKKRKKNLKKFLDKKVQK